jgi:NDP-sugar pyrophosphorylase family protein
MTGVILAGGLGTRLRATLPGTAKSVANVGGKPFLSFPLRQLADAGISHVVLCTGYLADQVRQTFGDEFNGIPISYSEETTPLGTGGAIRQAFENLDAPAPWIVLNGDSYLDVRLSSMAAHHNRSGVAATLAVTRVEDGSRFGEVEWDSSDRVTAFREKTGSPGPKWINAGIYILEREFLRALPGETPLSLEKDIFPAWTRRMKVFRSEGRFIDIGTPDSYAIAQSFFPEAPIDGRNFH